MRPRRFQTTGKTIRIDARQDLRAIRSPVARSAIKAARVVEDSRKQAGKEANKALRRNEQFVARMLSATPSRRDWQELPGYRAESPSEPREAYLVDVLSHDGCQMQLLGETWHHTSEPDAYQCKLEGVRGLAQPRSHTLVRTRKGTKVTGQTDSGKMVVLAHYDHDGCSHSQGIYHCERIGETRHRAHTGRPHATRAEQLRDAFTADPCYLSHGGSVIDYRRTGDTGAPVEPNSETDTRPVRIEPVRYVGRAYDQPDGPRGIAYQTFQGDRLEAFLRSVLKIERKVISQYK